MTQPIREINGVDARSIPDDILRSPEPVVLRGLVSQWPLVRAGLASSRAAIEYLMGFYRGLPVLAKSAGPEIRGRFFYNADLSGFNFKVTKARLDQVLAQLERMAGDAEAGTLYMGSTDIEKCLPGFRAENDVALGARTAQANIWIGNRTCVSAHQDGPDNLACVVVGRRRFTLFPPEEVGNLYVGPLEFTPSGQPVSMVDLAAPDFTRYPKFAQALARARVAELTAGDAVIIPSLWWHHIEGLDDFNALVNYWWDDVPAFMDAPLLALLFGMLTIRELPPEKRAAWQAQFEHYVFNADETTAAHIPENVRQVLGRLDAETVRRVKAYIGQRLKH